MTGVIVMVFGSRVIVAFSFFSTCILACWMEDSHMDDEYDVTAHPLNDFEFVDNGNFHTGWHCPYFGKFYDAALVKEESVVGHCKVEPTHHRQHFDTNPQVKVSRMSLEPKTVFTTVIIPNDDWTFDMSKYLSLQTNSSPCQ